MHNLFDDLNDNELKELDDEIMEGLMQEEAEQRAIYDKYYNLLTEEEKFDLAEESFIDDGYDDNWYLGPKYIVEGRKPKTNK